MHSHASASDHASDRSRLAGLAEALLNQVFVLPRPALHVLDLRTRRGWVDVVFEHPPNHFKPGLGQLVYEGFEVVPVNRTVGFRPLEQPL
jgi:hypothetical protein